MEIIGFFGLCWLVVLVFWALGSSAKSVANSVPKSGYEAVKVKNEWDSTRRFYVQSARWDNKTTSHIATIKDSYGVVPSRTVSALFKTTVERKIVKAMVAMQNAVRE